MLRAPRALWRRETVIINPTAEFYHDGQRLVEPCVTCAAPVREVADDIDSLGRVVGRLVDGAAACKLCGENVCKAHVREVLRPDFKIVNGQLEYFRTLFPHCSCCAVALALDIGGRQAKESREHFSEAHAGNNRGAMGVQALNDAIASMQAALLLLDASTLPKFGDA